MLHQRNFHSGWSVLAAGALFAGLCFAQSGTKDEFARTAAGHPDFSGIWEYSVALPVGGVKQVINGKVVYGIPDSSGRQAAKGEVPGALPFDAKPSYKADQQAKVAELDANQSRTDNVFYCGRPGVPRLGPPRKVVQTPDELIFLYEDMSGDTYRIIPVGAKHDEYADPSFNGDSIAWWDGDTLVVEATNFVEDTWFGEYGYFHTEDMKVTERFWPVGKQMAYQVTVEDPNVLAKPWTQAPRLIDHSDEKLIESAACVESDADLLTNKDHHLQR